MTVGSVTGGGGGDGYSCLKDLRVEINGGEGALSLCFWLYLSSSSPPPPFTPVLRQISTETKTSAPFLVLDEKRRMKLFPFLFLNKDVPVPVGPTPWKETSNASNEIVFPSEKWVHIGCEVASDLLRLHIDGEIVAEKHMNTSSSINRKPGSGRTYLAGLDRDDDKLRGYVHNVEILDRTTSIKDHLTKDPPMQLSIDRSSVSEIEEDSFGVWNIVGGVASCRKNFCLDVTLFDAFRQPIKTETEVFASLFYADNGIRVEKTKDGEAPLLISCDGIDYSCDDNPVKLINGRASFKLKISQLSSNCENRLFRIKFDIPKMGRFPFLEASFYPIRSISQNRNTANAFSKWKKLSSGVYKLGEIPSSGLDSGACELPFSIVHEAKLSPTSKRVKLEQGSSFGTCKDDLSRERVGEGCNSQDSTSSEDTLSLEGRLETHKNNLSDIDSDVAKRSGLDGISSNRASVTDLALFKYCLGSLNERALMLKEIVTVASERELHDFAQQVSLYMGCFHHGRQILVAKRLVEEGTKAWDLISQNQPHVMWEAAVPTIKVCFAKIACSTSRSLTHQDMELLRRISGSQELLTRENFERMWCWLYPVACMLSRRQINAMWNSQSPKWIEGFITKEEAEHSLQGLRGLQDPGTFVLRFPTSRSWPHPDAGNAVVTYMGRDYIIHHRMLSLEFVLSSSSKEMTSTPLHEMLLAEPELSRLGRIIRSH